MAPRREEWLLLLELGRPPKWFLRGLWLPCLLQSSPALLQDSFCLKSITRICPSQSLGMLQLHYRHLKLACVGYQGMGDTFFPVHYHNGVCCCSGDSAPFYFSLPQQCLHLQEYCEFRDGKLSLTDLPPDIHKDCAEQRTELGKLKSWAHPCPSPHHPLSSNPRWKREVTTRHALKHGK